MAKTTIIKKENILIVYVFKSSFVKRDISILENEYTVFKKQFNNNKLLLPLTLLKQFFQLLGIRKYKVVVSQSSGYHSFLPVLFGKLFNVPVIIIAIGNESIKIPEINYGAQRKKVFAWIVNFSFKNASLILPVHKSLEISNYSYTPIKYKQQGIRAFNPNISTRIIEMVNGYDTEKWKNLGLTRPTHSFLTVSAEIDTTRYFIKGIDLICEAAKLFPNYSFTIVGHLTIEKDFPSNITLINRLNQIELLKVYNQHSYYLQLSMSEGFPNALCEAMLCGCIPIGSKVAGIPDIIGENGIILNEKKTDEFTTILKTLNNYNFEAEKIRNQIVTNYPLNKRKTEFLAHLKKNIKQ